MEEREEGEVEEREEGEVEEREEGEVSEGDGPHSLELSEDDVRDDQLTSHSFQDHSGVDWGEVEAGYAAGMPGRWELVESDDVTSTQPEAPTSPTQELLGALKRKAQAFADQEWQQYWSSAGPVHLAWSWKQQYPGIPLTKVECLSGVDFLCQSLQTHMTLNTTQDSDQLTNVETRQEEDGCCMSPSEHATSSEHVEMTVGASTAEEPREVGVAIPTEEGGGREEPSDTEVLAMWNQFYNQHYWSHYSWFRGEQGPVDITGEEEEEEGALMGASHSGPEETVGAITHTPRC